MPYGCAGCRCWPDETPAYGLDRETWYPNAMCPHHGMMADDDAEGTAPAPPQPTGAQAEEAYAYLRGEVESPPCPWDGMYGPHQHVPNATGDPVCLVPRDIVDLYADPTLIGPKQPKKEKRGRRKSLFAALQRFGDWLDPHASAEREYRHYLSEWRRGRSGVDGGDAGPEGGKR